MIWRREGTMKEARKQRKVDGKGGRKEDRHATRQDFTKETDSVKLPKAQPLTQANSHSPSDS